MKHLIRNYVVDTYALWLTSQVATGMVFEGGYRTLFIAGLALMGVSLLAKPIINLMLLPLNMVTFGLFRWVSFAIVLYLVTLIVKQYKITAFIYTGLQNKWLEIPALHFEGLWAFIAFSFILSMITSFIYWVIK
jgi:uncharacterized membrane protein YvlD (DUF360 family)